MKRSILIALATAAALSAGALAAQEGDRGRGFPGQHMMSPQERDDYHAKMRAAQTAEERERIRAEHHALMQERMKARGMGHHGGGECCAGGHGMGHGR